MALIFLENTNENIKTVTSIHYQPQLLPQEVASKGIEISESEIPTPQDIIGKIPVLKYNTTNHTLFYEYVDRPLTPEEELRQRIELMQQALDDLLLGGM
jgi:hypothetical protein